MGNIYDFSYKHSHQNGKSIIFTERDDKKLTAEDLNAVQLKMIQSNNIPHLLSLSIENIDLTIKVHYKLTSKQKVTSFFQENRTTMSDYYQLFLAIISTLEESGSYMLDQQQFILQKEFVYIGEKPGDVYLTYLPVTGMKRESTIEEDMKKLLTDIAGEVEGLQGNEFKSILNYIKNPAFGLSGLKKLLLELISLRSNVNQNQDMYYNNPNANFADNANPGTGQNNYQPITPGVHMEETVSKSKKKAKRKLPPLSSRGRIYLIMGSLLAIAFIWKLYDMYTNQTVLIASSLLTLVVLVFDYVFWKVWRPGMTPIKDKAEVPNNSSENKTAMPNVQINKQPVFQQQVTKKSEPLIAQTSSFIAQNSIAATAMDTTFLSESNEDTVLLEDETNLHVVESQQQQVVSAILVRESAGEQAQTVEINANNFLIGRNEASVNFKDESIGISRIHAEIIKIDDSSYGLKDLGSKNGSKLNGNTLVPYKIYALNTDDQFELGKAIYTFKWSHS
ncbi:DUF6382 domain-containing protein [Oceanobacillus chungangensis]|uniref:FHA domain-containing protein n=1 Tax=Oceanobacillus chungangensis TaxID=1229152 RepID=A0A3D8Q0D4_9BACI|nr:DUF6382 domain-containing protein [Oceanobacillus chungangensis]RDW21724.1 hypothetical protein CWR45_02295 [Oceanobacillus chungangensis]